MLNSTEFCRVRQIGSQKQQNKKKHEHVGTRKNKRYHLVENMYVGLEYK